jgi:DNA segregation ATPase FtsK/SpoIIIE-like protein
MLPAANDSRSGTIFMDSEFEVERAEGPETQVAAPPQIDPVPKVPPAKLRTAVLIGAAVLIILLLAGGVTLFKRAQDEQVLAKETETNSVPAVAVIHPTAEKPDQDLVLPGTLQAYEESPIFARTNGYLVRWYKDIGSPIRQGELLAEIDTPEIDQELMQTRAARQQVEAQLQLARTSDERWKSLRQTDSVSQQEADQQSSAYQQSKANLAAADANVRRLDPPQRRSRRFDQCRRRRPGTFRHRQGRSASRLRECAAGLCAKYQGRDESRGYAARVPRPEVSGLGGTHRGSHRHGDSYAAYRSRRAQ